MKTVYLHGKLGKRFGRKWRLAAQTPAEIFQAIDANTEGFVEYIYKSSMEGVDFTMLSKDPRKITNKQDAENSFLQITDATIKYKCEEIHIVPAAQGAAIVSGMIVFGGGLFAAGTLGSLVLTSLVYGTVAGFAMNLLFKPPKPPKRSDPTSTKSFLISGGITRQAQGVAVPLGYGRLMVGSTNVVSTQSIRKINSTKNAEVLESYAELEYLDLISEGPIHGFVDKNGGEISGGDIREGIFLNNVQIKSTQSGRLNYIINEKQDSKDGAPTFKDGGSVNQPILSDKVFSNIDYGVLLYGPAPYEEPKGEHTLSSALDGGAKIVSHFVSNREVGQVTVSFKAELAEQKDDGGTNPFSVRFAILISRRNGEFNVLDPLSECEVERLPAITKNPNAYNGYFELKGIASSTYQFDVTIKYNPKLNSSEISGGVTFKIVKISRELDQSTKGGETGGIAKRRVLQVSSVAEAIDQKLLYPHCAMAKIMIDGKNFSSAPSRKYHVKLKKLLIPENYDPVSRKYNGPWNGLFKGQNDSAQSINEISDSNRFWSDNPAWVFFDLLHNPRYGIGKYGLEESNIDRWQLYKVAKYCDELVETDFPIETQDGDPRSFSTSGSFSEDNFTISVDALIGTGAFPILVDFEQEFGNGTSFSGKKVAFFIFQHNYGNGDLSSSDINFIKKGSISRRGEFVIEERVIISSSVANRTVTLVGPNFGDNPAAFGSSNTVIGSCAVQINHPIVEPRFTSNLYLNDRSEALQIINSIASVFRGMATYIGGKVSVTSDKLQNPVQLFNSSNIINSDINYTGISKNKKPTAVIVRYNNKDKGFKPDLVYEEDANAMKSLGYVEHEAMGFGVTSEGQARRLAKWMLMTAQLETETVKFIAGQEAAYLLPGLIFELSDEARTGTDKSGRVLGVELYRNRKIINNSIQESINSFDPYILIDKNNTSTPTYSRIELTVYCAKSNETLQGIDRRSGFETSSDDQDQEIESLRTPQLVRFEGSIYTDGSINKYGPQGQKTIVSDLALKMPIIISLPDNLIKLYDHGFNNGFKLFFITDGVLPGGIKFSEDNTANYFVVNSSRHTFQVSETENGAPINIFSLGKDRFNNEGGLHYVSTNSQAMLADALDQINLGATYSIKGLIGVKSKDFLSPVEMEKLGIVSDSEIGEYWVKSDFLGFMYLRGDWAYLDAIGWVYVKMLRERVGSDYWFYVQQVGWVFTTDQLKNTFWFISNSNTWVHVVFNNSGRDYLTGFFVYDSSASAGNPNQLSSGSTYILGDSKKITIREVLSTGDYIGYSISGQEEFWFQVEGLTSEPGVINNTNPNYRVSNIKYVYSVGADSSVQGEPAIRIEIDDGHNMNLNRNGEVEISELINAAMPANGLWNIVRVDENTIELVSSASSSTTVPELGQTGSQVTAGQISLTESISSLVDRFLEAQLFRTLSVKELPENKYEVSGVEYNYSKFSAVDSKGAIRNPSLPIPPQADMSIPEAPDGLLLFDLTV